MTLWTFAEIVYTRYDGINTTMYKAVLLKLIMEIAVKPECEWDIYATEPKQDVCTLNETLLKERLRHLLHNESVYMESEKDIMEYSEASLQNKMIRHFPTYMS